MHFAPQPDNPLAYLNGLGYMRASPPLGQYAAAATAAYELFKSSNTDQSSGMPGSRTSNPSVPRQPGAVTTVSPAIQVQVSPQISPTMVQQQSSPGATVGANPVQYMPGGQQASTGVSPYGNYADPSMPTRSGMPYGGDISPYQPYTVDPRTGNFIPLGEGSGQYSPITVGQSGMTEIPWLPIALVGGVVLAAMAFKKKPKGKK